MKTFQVTCAIEKARGFQIWEVSAKNANEALKKFNAGDCHFIEDEIEIIEIGTPQIEEIKPEKIR